MEFIIENNSQRFISANTDEWLSLGELDASKVSFEKEAGKFILHGTNGVKIIFESKDFIQYEGMNLFRKNSPVDVSVNGNPVRAKNDNCRDYDSPSSCYLESTSCALIVLICHYCCYDSDGKYAKSKSEACGVCVGFPI